MNKIIYILLLIFTLCGCTAKVSPLTGKSYWTGPLSLDDSQYKKEVMQYEYFENNPNLSPEIKEKILKGIISTGMTKDQVLASWQEPDRKNRSVYSNSVREQWIYDRYSPDKGAYSEYLYFDNGVLTGWQD